MFKLKKTEEINKFGLNIFLFADKKKKHKTQLKKYTKSKEETFYLKAPMNWNVKFSIKKQILKNCSRVACLRELGGLCFVQVTVKETKMFIIFITLWPKYKIFATIGSIKRYHNLTAQYVKGLIDKKITAVMGVSKNAFF